MFIIDGGERIMVSYGQDKGKYYDFLCDNQELQIHC